MRRLRDVDGAACPGFEKRLLFQVIWELAVGFGLSLVMTIGLAESARLIGFEAEWNRSTWGRESITFFMLLTGPGYVATRIGVRLWLFWDRMRRRRMLWALTHAHLLVVMLAMVLVAVGMLLAYPYSRSTTPLIAEASGPIVWLADWLLMFAFPLGGIWILMTLFALAVVLPPSALFSFLVARRTTRRLEKLATTATAMRNGNYDARVAVAGEDEVAQLQSDFNAMADTLQSSLRALQSERDRVAQLLQSRRELVASVSHELRTPVATARALLDSALMRQTDAPPALQHDLQVMQGEIARLQMLIDDLFTLSRAETSSLVLDCKPADVGPIVQRMVNAIQPWAWQAGRVEMVADAPQGLPPVCIDTERLEQILANLLRNGVRHTPPGGIVAAAVFADAEHVSIVVRDTGEGIAVEDLPHIWERFYRGENHSSDEGAGLGLAIVKELTEAMGGTVAVESTPSQGSCFTLRFPRTL
jgi:signal transduction histidine kinase